MRRAWTIKLATLIALIGEWALVSGVWCVVSMVLTLGAAIALLTWAIVVPSASLFVRAVCSFDAEKIGRRNAFALTFDDGPDPIFTPLVLDLLRDHGARATFFVVGKRVDAAPGLVRRMIAEGHSVGSHTWDHSSRFHFQTARSMRSNIEKGRVSVRSAIGMDAILFRPPQGLTTPTLADALGNSGLVTVLWTARALDAMGRSADRIVSRVAPCLKPGAIITMHDGGGFGGTIDRSPTVDALARILEIARDRGLCSVALETALEIEPRS